MASKTEQETKTCNCTEGCSKQSCSCCKTGSKCNSSCGCLASCQNIFNHLDYFFGENNQCSPNLCFSHWLMKKVNNVEDLQLIDRDALLKLIRKSSTYPCILDYDEELQEWEDKRKIIKPDEKLAHTQELFRILLSEGGSDYYYSFCNDNIAEDDSDWHCIRCKTCHDWRVYRCRNCHRCTHGMTSPCQWCGVY